MTRVGVARSQAQRLAGRPTLLALLGIAIVFLLSPITWATAAVETEDNCASAANPIVCENALPGDPESKWQVTGVGDSSIQGFATSMSVNVGETESFKINTPAKAYNIEILRLGYYGGNGAHIVASGITPTATLPQNQPECLKEPSTGLIDCGNWGVSAHWTVPSTAVSGIYMALLTRTDTGKKSQIIFVVRNDASHSKILLQTSDATWEAYNAYGGNSLYTCTVDCPPGNPKSYKGAFAVSYNRPDDGSLVTDAGASYYFYAEYQLALWLERNGYDVSYTGQAAVDQKGSLLKNHQIFMSSGHDEYWSAGQRANVEAAREAGVNLTFFSGNEIFWKTRWGPSIDGSETSYRTLTTYKETHFEGPVDPKDPPTWTGAWRDPRSPHADGGRPENSLSGQQFEINSGTSEIAVPSQYSKLRVWRNTEVASLKAGKTLTLAPDTGTLGYEWDEDVDNGFRPAGEYDLSSTTDNGLQAFTDYGSTLNENATATHHLTLYRAPSGALVFGAGTVQWSWGLYNENAWNESSTAPGEPDPNMEQFTVNLLAEMGAQPGSLTTGLVAASQSTDKTPPTSTITSPAQGETLQDGSSATITGTATDAGGGVVAGVEVSTDNGTTWHPATLTTPAESSVKWSYTWTANHSPTTIIKSRAVDDSGNLETPAAGVQIKVSCPCSIWGTGETPSTPDSGDSNSIVLGVKFSSEVSGTVTGVRFYKASTNKGTHIGSLWSASGTLLASATFTGETASGWQQVTFSTPVQIAANTTYVASYLAPSGHYADSPEYFYTPPPTGGNILNSPPLHAVSASGEPVGGVYGSENGLYAYSASNAFPTSTNEGDNYWVDPVFEPATLPGQVTNVQATAGLGSASVKWNAPSSGGAVTKYTITPYIESVAQPSTTITGTPPATSATISELKGGTSYTFTVTASNSAGSGTPSPSSNAVTPTGSSVPAAPTGVTASAENEKASVSWTAPPNNGSAITKYTVTPYKNGVTEQTPTTITGNPPETSATITGLSNGTSYTFTVTATNGLGTGPPSSQSNAVTPAVPDTIFGSATPATVDSGDANSVELGVKFSSEVAGNITGIRFYKASTNTGTHIGSLWSASGTLLASATFTGESASGWQQVKFSSPVAISANTTYVAAYLAPKGHYSDTASAFTKAGVSSPPLLALANTTSPNGVYSYSTTSVFPTSNFKATNYWVDVNFEPASATVPGQVTNVQATAGLGSASVKWNAPSSGGAVTKYTITPYIESVAQPSTTITGTPPATSATISELKGGTSYTFTVTASNSAGSGTPSPNSNAVTPTASSVPAAPTGVTATAGNEKASVTWTAPPNGGGPITKYTITPYKNGVTEQTPTTITGNPPQTNATITGLSNGTSYTFTVTASNEVGESPKSNASNAVTPTAPTVPAAPTGVTATAGNEKASVTWTAPANNGSPITKYTITPYIESVAQPSTTITGTPPATSATISELKGGTSYTFTVTASNEVGESPPSSASNAVTPTAPTVPAAPTGVTATAGNEKASVTWTAPANNGSPITKYTITPYIESVAQPSTTITGTPPATSATISELKGGTSYTFTVTASNEVGESPPSSASNAVTPTAPTVPAAPTGVTATAGNEKASVTWTAPANNGSAITKYTVTPYKNGVTEQTPTTITGNPPETSAIITGLSNGTSYAFTVSATNGLGTGPPSSQSNAVTPAAPAVPDTIFGSATPATVDSGDANSVELGVKFSSEVAGNITGIRFYKASTNTGTHIGSLWSASGTLLASATFTGESASGWQQVKFSSPVAISANTTYVAAYLAPNGHYSDTASAFTKAGVSSPPLLALANTTSPNGVYSYSTTSVFPTSNFKATNYWVDVNFEPASATVPGQVTNVQATAGLGSASVKWNAPSSGGAVTKYTITPYIESVAQPSTTITGTPPATSATISELKGGTSYTFTVTASNSAGSGTPSPNSNAVTPTASSVPAAPTGVTATAENEKASVTWTAPPNNGSPITKYTITPYKNGVTEQTPTTITGKPPQTNATITGLSNGTSYTFTVTASNEVGESPQSGASNAVTPEEINTIFALATPATVDSEDGNSVELGVKFSSEVAGNITGIRFYKASTNTGTHIGSLWSASGTLLASATFTGETTEGWQQVNFSTPVAIAANTTYVAGYFAPNGHYSDSSSAFATAGVSNPPLFALANTTSANGVYSYSPVSTFPSSTFNATNYWVDVEFVRGS